MYFDWSHLWALSLVSLVNLLWSSKSVMLISCLPWTWNNRRCDFHLDEDDVLPVSWASLYLRNIFAFAVLSRRYRAEIEAKEKAPSNLEHDSCWEREGINVGYRYDPNGLILYTRNTSIDRTVFNPFPRQIDKNQNRSRFSYSISLQW